MATEVLVAIIGGVAGLVGAGIGAGVQFLISRRQHKLEETQLGLEERGLELERLKMLYESVPMLGQGAPPDAETPDVFDKEYNAYLEVIDSEEERLTKQVYGLEKLPTQNRFGRLADQHVSRARTLWSSNRIPDAYRSAIHYRLAGYCYAKATRPHEAGWNYHFAGHKLRSIDEWERAAECYQLSAEEFKNSTHPDALGLTKRAAKRAIACLKQVEEHQRAREIEELFSPFESS